MNPTHLETWLLDNKFQSEAVSARNPAGQYALILAAQQGRIDVLQCLLQPETDLNIVDAYPIFNKS